MIAEINVEPLVNNIVAQGPLACAMAAAILYLAKKIKECELDRNKLWDRVADLAEKIGESRNH